MADITFSDWQLGPDDRLFAPGADWRSHAVLTHRSSLGQPYALGFRMAADALLERGLDEHEQDLLVFPILFCYRHAIELELKDLIYLGQRWAGDRSTVITTHRLPELWKRARAVIESAWPDEDTSQLDAVGRVIGELASVDPEAVQFRYDRDTKGRSRQLPDELMRVDLHKVQAVAGKVIAHLEAAYTGMDEMLQAADFE